MAADDKCPACRCPRMVDGGGRGGGGGNTEDGPTKLRRRNYVYTLHLLRPLHPPSEHEYSILFGFYSSLLASL